MFYKAYNPSFSNCPLKPNRGIWVIPEFCFSLLSKINYNIALSGLFCIHKNLQNFVNAILIVAIASGTKRALRWQKFTL